MVHFCISVWEITENSEFRDPSYIQQIYENRPHSLIPAAHFEQEWTTMLITISISKRDLGNFSLPANARITLASFCNADSSTWFLLMLASRSCEHPTLVGILKFNIQSHKHRGNAA